MPTEIMAVGSTAASSADTIIAAGATLTVALKAASGPAVRGAVVQIMLKDDAGQYFLIDELNSAQPALVIAGAGTYQFRRIAGVACGVFSG